MNYRELQKEGQSLCLENEVSDQSAQMLMLEMCRNNNFNLYLDYNEEVEDSFKELYWNNIQRLCEHEPLSYVLGYDYFYGYQFKVNHHVLIPRDETEELVANTLAYYDELFKGQVVDVIDVGCGSGAIGIALSLEEKNMNVTGCDISSEALIVAKENNDNLQANVNFVESDMLKYFVENNIKVDMLISNPPYIKSDAKLESSVIDYEPKVALFGGVDGLFFYNEILTNAHLILKDKYLIGFEIGYDQKDDILKLANSYFPNDFKEIVKDINGKDRMLFITNIK
ncbi:MAG: peptide chain release factor N(5)-glutamine methyltransferase [Erysipelotrichaceae bacterium]